MRFLLGSAAHDTKRRAWAAGVRREAGAHDRGPHGRALAGAA